jgi:hypothetical protein
MFRLKVMPAGRLLKVMELGYSKSLGVDSLQVRVVRRSAKRLRQFCNSIPRPE